MLRASRLPSPWLHIGGGSNLLFTKDWPGTVLHSRINGVEPLHEDGEQAVVRVGSGVVWDDFVAMCVERGWYGAEGRCRCGTEYRSLWDGGEGFDTQGGDIECREWGNKSL